MRSEVNIPLDVYEDLQEARIVQHLHDLTDRWELLKWDVEPMIEGESQLWSDLFARYLLDVDERLQQCLKIEQNVMAIRLGDSSIICISSQLIKNNE